MADASAMTNPLFDLWRKQFEESAATWARMVGQAQTPVDGPTPSGARAQPGLAQGAEFAHTPVGHAPRAQWKQFSTSGDAWSKALGQDEHRGTRDVGKYWTNGWWPARR